MKKAFLLPLVLFGFCCAEANAAFLNDSESFVIARSVKLGDTGISVSPGGGTGTKKLSCTADDPDCKGPIICKKDTQCPAGQYCKLGFCKPLCDEGKTAKGVKCADIPRTPNCTIKDGGHKDYCACTETSCGEAFKCATKDGELQCVVCPAGEQCGCPDKKISSGTGLCVTCNVDADCADNEKCVNGGKNSAYCEKLSCPDGTRPINHDCGGCNDLTPNCETCTETQCLTCEPAYDLIDGKCVLKTCEDGQYLNMDDGKCYLQAGKCYTTQDCENYNKCVNNSCVDNCYGVNCAAKDPQYPTCSSSYQPGSYYCKCTSSSCKAGYKCSGGGTCQQIDGCSKDKDCNNGQKCLNKKCVDSCTNVECKDPKFPKCISYTWTTNRTACYCTETSCGTGYKCDKINCKKIGSCDKHSDCDGGQKCSNGKCISSCTGATCPQTEPVCNAGTSFTNWYTCRCTETSCGEGYECISGDCRVRQTEKCKTDDDCSAEKKCSYGYCIFRNAK